MTPYRRILVLAGGPAIAASLAVAAIFLWTNTASSQLRTDQSAGVAVQALGDQLLAAIHEQRESLDEYLLSSDTRLRDRYRLAVAAEADAAAQIGTGVGTLSRVDLSGVVDALGRVDSENDVWRATIAGPAIVAVQSDSVAAITSATRLAVNDQDGTQIATNRLVAEIDALQSQLDLRSDGLGSLRAAAAVFGVVIELLAAAFSLWFVRRYGLAVARDSLRRTHANAERIQIIASLRTLRTQKTPEATAALIAEALKRLPGVDLACVFECTDDAIVATAVLGDGFPLRTGETVDDSRARYLRDRSRHGPWAERWVQRAEVKPYDESFAALGIKSLAFAPIRSDGEVIGLIGIATTDKDHGLHMVEDLPAVGEFASVAETILAPAFIAHHRRTAERRHIAATISSGGFRPVFQPIVDLATGSMVGFEALTRFDDGGRPDVTFARAHACGLGIELETATLRAAVREARYLPPVAWLALNVSPMLLGLEHSLGQLLADMPRAVVLEVTEHEAIEAYAPLREAMLAYGAGVRLSVDDVGAGVANFNHLAELRPSFLKIDLSLVRGVDADPGRKAVVVGLVHFAALAGCQVIAEGIETAAEQATVMELGVTLGQGYLIARPAQAETWGIARAQTALSPSLPSAVERRTNPAPAGIRHPRRAPRQRCEGRVPGIARNRARSGAPESL